MWVEPQQLPRTGAQRLPPPPAQAARVPQTGSSAPSETSRPEATPARGGELLPTFILGKVEAAFPSLPQMRQPPPQMGSRRTTGCHRRKVSSADPFRASGTLQLDVSGSLLPLKETGGGGAASRSLTPPAPEAKCSPACAQPQNCSQCDHDPLRLQVKGKCRGLAFCVLRRGQPASAAVVALTQPCTQGHPHDSAV